MRGGYHIVDLKEKPLTPGNETTIPGIFKQAFNPNDKATLLTGFVIAGDTNERKQDTFVEFARSSSNCVTTFSSGATLNITNDDGVTYTDNTNIRKRSVK